MFLTPCGVHPSLSAQNWCRVSSFRPLSTQEMLKNISTTVRLGTLSEGWFSTTFRLFDTWSRAQNLLTWWPPPFRYVCRRSMIKRWKPICRVLFQTKPLILPMCTCRKSCRWINQYSPIANDDPARPVRFSRWDVQGECGEITTWSWGVFPLITPWVLFLTSSFQNTFVITM